MSDGVHLDNIDNAFTQGGNRLCFFHPDDAGRCIKVVRPDRTPEIRRKQKRFPKNLKPLSRFDENRNEIIEIQRIKKYIGDGAFDVIPKYFGMLESDLGPGLCCEMIRDDDGKVSISLKQYIWVYGLTDSLNEALNTFKTKWIVMGMPSRDLLLHNIVVQQENASSDSVVKRLVVIDGLGWAGFSFLFYRFHFLAVSKAKKKIAGLDKSVTQLLHKKENQSDWGYHGWLNEDQRLAKTNDK